MVFDTETTVDTEQRLLFGTALLAEVSGDNPLAMTVLAEYVFSADDLPASDQHVIETYVEARRDGAEHPLAALSSSRFLNEVFWPLAYHQRWAVVGFNLPFDISRLADHWGTSREDPSAFSLRLGHLIRRRDGREIENWRLPRVVIKSLDSKRAFIRFASANRVSRRDRVPEGSPTGKPDAGYHFRGHFLDVKTLAFALFDRSLSLSSLGQELDIEHPKSEFTEYGEISDQILDYARRDVIATAECALKLVEEFERHPVASGIQGVDDREPVRRAPEVPPLLGATAAYSPASIGKAYLVAMGITPILQRQPDFPPDILGKFMAAFYGGRAETMIIRTPVPVVMLDILSSYPTINALSGHFQLLTASRLDVEDCTAEVEHLLQTVTLADGLDPALFRQIACVVVDCVPSGQHLPVRGEFAPGGFNIALAPLYDPQGRAFSYMAADLVASRLRGDPVPLILRAQRVVGHGRLAELRPVSIRGQRAVDPTEEDFFVRLIELRKSLKHDQGLSETERQRLDRALKVVANATGYGIFAEVNVVDARGDSVRALDIYSRGIQFQTNGASWDECGRYSFPPLSSIHRPGAGA